MPGASNSVTIICEEGGAGRRGAVALILGPRQLPVLAVVEHLPSPCPPVWPPPPPLDIRVSPGHVHVPARSFTAAETGKVLVSETKREEGQDPDRGPAGVTKDSTGGLSEPRALRDTDLTHTKNRTDGSAGKPWSFLRTPPGCGGQRERPTSCPQPVSLLHSPTHPYNVPTLWLRPLGILLALPFPQTPHTQSIQKSCLC